MFTSPLENIRIASHCRSDWDQMYGDDRRRFCGECQMNVYNLSEMSRGEAESFLLNAEGRLCVRYYRRRDGSVITKDCPVGWRALKRRVSRVGTATFSVIVGFFAGLAGIRATESFISILPTGNVPPVEIEESRMAVDPMPIVGEVEEMEGQMILDEGYFHGKPEGIEPLKKMRVKGSVK